MKFSPILLVCSAFILILLFTGLFHQWCAIKDSPVISIIVRGQEVYRGSAACVDVSDVGSITDVQIGRGPFCYFPGEHYSSETVIVREVK